MVNLIKGNFNPNESSEDVLLGILRQGARRLLAQSIEAEANDYIDRFRNCRDEQGHRLVVRNGYKPTRTIQTGLGDIPVRQPRIHDRRRDVEGNKLNFESMIIPPYLRRTKSIDDMIPWLYLKGISTGDFPEALQALLGPGASGLSVATIVRLKSVWEKEYQAWTQRSLVGKRYVYFWVDGVHFKIRLEGERQCLLVIMGATVDGHKELVAVEDGFRESKNSWQDVLRDLKKRGLVHAPKLAIGDGGLGFWAALAEEFDQTTAQRCWVHKSANVLNYMPKKVQPQAKAQLHAIWMAETKVLAEQAFDTFIATYETKYKKAVACLLRDRGPLLAFYDFPAEHWKHIRTTNPIESTFATVRLRTKRTKGCGSRWATLSMVFRLVRSAEKSWRRLDKSEYLTDLIHNVRFRDGIRKAA